MEGTQSESSKWVTFPMHDIETQARQCPEFPYLPVWSRGPRGQQAPAEHRCPGTPGGQQSLCPGPSPGVSHAGCRDRGPRRGGGDASGTALREALPEGLGPKWDPRLGSRAHSGAPALVVACVFLTHTVQSAML